MNSSMFDGVTSRDAALISAGTIATLTGFTKYVQVDVVHASFVRHCQDVGARGRWQDHWAQFWCGR